MRVSLRQYEMTLFDYNQVPSTKASRFAPFKHFYTLAEKIRKQFCQKNSFKLKS